MEGEFDDLTLFQISAEDQIKIAEIQGAQSAKPKTVGRKRRADEKFALITHADAVAGYMALGSPAALVWYALLYREWAEKHSTVRVPTKLLRFWHLSRWTWARALVRLEAGGLIEVERRRGRAAKVTIVRR